MPSPSVPTFGELFDRLRDLPALVQWAGYVGLFAIIFTETGLFFGFFLPGDSLLVTAGLLAAPGPQHLPLDLTTLGLALSAAAILGDNTNYWVGRLSGPKIFARDDSLLFKKKHLQRAADFYAMHGPKAVVFARFMPVVRTFAPLVAGAAGMRYPTFLTYSVVGGLAWIWSMLLAGYVLGTRFPGLTRHLELLIIGVVLLSVSPAIVSWWRARRATRVTAAS